jgi:hypothetical protein
VFWLEADAIGGAPANNDPVAIWNDQSPRHLDVTQTVGAAQPLYKTGIFGLGNTRPGILFDGTDDVLNRLSPVTTAVDNFTIILVAKRISGQAAPVMVGNDGADGYALATSCADGVGNIGWLRGGLAWHGTATAPTTSSALYMLDRRAGTTTIYLNGVSQGTFGSAPNAPTNETRIGNHDKDEATNFFNGYIGAVVVAEGWTIAQRDAIHADLASKWVPSPNTGAVNVTEENDTCAAVGTVTGVVFQLEADTLTLVDDDPVDLWDDIGGHHVEQATSPAQPIYKTNIFGALPGLRFDGVDAVLNRTSPVCTAVDNFTVLLVCNRLGVNSSAPVAVGNDGADGWALAPSTAGFKVGWLRSGIAWEDTTTSDALGPAIYMLDRRAGTATVYKTGTALTPTFTSAPSTPTAETRIGSHDAGEPTAFFDGYIGAVVIAVGWTTVERDDFHDALLNKWMPAVFTVDTAILTLGGQDVAVATVTTLAFTVDPAALTLVGQDTVVAGTGAASSTVDPAVLTLSGIDITAAGTGVAAVTVDVALLTLTGIDITVAGTGVATTPIDVAPLVLTGVDITVAAGTTFTVDPATLTLTGIDPTVTGTGAAVTTVDPAALTLTGVDLAVAGTGTASATVDPATLVLSGVDIIVAGTGSASVAIDVAALVLSGQDIALAGTGVATFTIDAAALVLTGVDITVATGAVTLTFTVDPAIVTLAGQDVAVSGTGGAPLTIDPAGLTLTGIDLSLAGVGVATTAIDSAILTLVGGTVLLVGVYGDDFPLTVTVADQYAYIVREDTAITVDEGATSATYREPV